MDGSVVITLNDNSFVNKSELIIYNSMGKTMTTELITKTTTTIDTNFPTGVYFYKLTSNDSSQKGKFIVK
jgi:hypothetical protein